MMMMVTGIVGVAAMIVAADVPRLLKNKLKKELWVFSILLLSGTSLAIALALRMKLPNPADWISIIYKPVSDLVYSWLR